MTPQFWVDGSSGDVELEKHIAKRFTEIWNRFESPKFRNEFRQTLEDKFFLFKTKNASYGSNNIAALGTKGIFVRIWDKVQRLRNLVWDDKKNPLADESIEDTFGDLAVYSIMAVVLLRGEWPKYQEPNFSKEPDQLKEALNKQVYDKDRFYPPYSNEGLEKLRARMENGDK